jgi:hypothetical protein
MNGSRQTVETHFHIVAAPRSLTRVRDMLTRDLPLALVVLVLFVSLAELTHVHPDGAKLRQHSCSICSSVHDGVRVQRVYVPSPLVASSETLGTADEVLRSLLTIHTICIRPPPSV